MRLSYFRYLLLPALCVVGIGTAGAATFTVNSPGDSHDLSPGDGQAVDGSGLTTLRAAVEEANSLEGPDTVVVTAATSPIRISLGELTVEDNHVYIRGEEQPVIDGVNNPLNASTLVIGADSVIIEGLTFRRSRFHAVVITGSSNRLGSNSGTGRITFIGNGLDNPRAAAVAIEGPNATGNIVRGCYIGMFGNGTLVDGNRNGVIVSDGAHGNTVGGNNLISGNEGYGVILRNGARDNQITANKIGSEVAGDSGPGNGSGGILLTEGAHNNLIGGDSLRDGNLISANGGHGIELMGYDVTDNVINGNFIGTDITGLLALPNEGDGIHIADGSSNNLIGGSFPHSGNLISGNRGSGVHLTGAATSENRLLANIIGLDIRGYVPVSNGTGEGDGVLIDAGSHHNSIGGQGEYEANIISGNVRSGVHIDGSGSNDNIVAGNLIGLSGIGNSSAYNGTGVIISGGAKSNLIGGSTGADRNYISGNRAELFPGGAGVLITNPGTDFNQVCGNYIGLDVAGSRALRNGSAGVIIADGARYNVIGGEETTGRNVISGNGATEPIPGHASGVHLYGKGTSFNRVTGNDIGWSASRLTIIPNAGHGVGLYAGASDNRIGGNAVDSGNSIIGNDLFGIYVSDAETRRNLIRNNTIKQNDSLSIAIRNSAQEGIQPPVLNPIPLSAPWEVSGHGAPPGGIIDFYLTSSLTEFDEALQFLFSATADSAGDFSTSTFELSEGDYITAIATDSNRNSSALAASVRIGTVTDVDDKADAVPYAYKLEQNYPNPFNPETQINFSLARASQVDLSVYNVLGRKVTMLINDHMAAGEHSVEWDGTDYTGRTVASGMYLYRLTTDEYSSNRKMLLLK